MAGMGEGIGLIIRLIVTALILTNRVLPSDASKVNMMPRLMPR